MNRNTEEMARYEADKIAFAKRLNQVLDQMGWPVRGRIAKLKRLLRDPISEVGAGKWLNGDSLPELKRISDLSRITGKSVQWLLTGVDVGENNNIEPSPFPVYQVPLISWVSAGMLCCTGDLPSADMAEVYETSPVKVGSRAYALTVKGDSMTSLSGGKSYPDGVVIIVDPDVEATPPCRVIARVGDETTFKELVVDMGQWYLKPLNPQYPMIKVDERVSICGVVKCTVMKE